MVGIKLVLNDSVRDSMES